MLVRMASHQSQEPSEKPSERLPGSGFATPSALAVERLLAALISRAPERVAEQLSLLELECDKGNCGMAPDEILKLVEAAAVSLYPNTVRANRPGEGHGDVLVHTSPEVWIEVKAQTKKHGIRDLTQADWIRDECNVLRWLHEHDAEFAEALPAGLAEKLGQPGEAFREWSLSICWLADLCGLTSENLLLEEDMVEPAEIVAFAERKQVVFLNQSGIWFGGLAQLPTVKRVLDGGSPEYRLNFDNTTVVAVPTWTAGEGERGKVDFTYHLYADGLGRHKLHSSAVSGLSHVAPS